MYHYYFLLEFDFIQEPTFCIVENLGCFLRITEEVFVWMILDAGFEMNELITISALPQLPPSPCSSSPKPPPHRCTPPTHLMSQISSSISNDISQFRNLKET